MLIKKFIRTNIENFAKLDCIFIMNRIESSLQIHYSICPLISKFICQFLMTNSTVHSMIQKNFSRSSIFRRLFYR